MRDIKYCSSCGNKLNSDSIFCDKCGQKVTKETSEIIKCPFCQSSLQKNVIKCPNCGEWINKSQKPINKKANNIFKKINKLLSNKKLFYIPYIVFIYALINTIFYHIINLINQEYFVYDTNIDYTIFYPGIDYTHVYHLTHKMDSFTQFIHQIGIILYGDFDYARYPYALSGGITNVIDLLWFILFLISLIVSIHVFNKKNLKSYIYLLLTIISFILMLFCSKFIRFSGNYTLLIILLLIILTITLIKISKHFQEYE